MTAPVVAHADHGAVQSAHGREQRGGSIALVVVGHGSAAPLLEWQPRLRTVQRLDPAFLVGAQHDGVFRRIEIEPNDGLQFLGELGIVTQLEGARQVRLQAMLMPDPPHTFFTDARCLRHGARAPVSRVIRRLPGGLPDYILNLGRRDRPGSSGPGSILLQTGKALLQEALTPSSGLLVADVHRGGDFQILLAVRSQKDDLCSLDLTDGQRARSGPLFQGLSLLIIEHYRWGNTHARLPHYGSVAESMGRIEDLRGNS